MIKPKYYEFMYSYVDRLSCPQLAWLKKVIKEVEAVRKKRMEEFENEKE